MASLAPPPLPPGVSFSDDDSLRRLRLRAVQVMASSATIVGTAWLCMITDWSTLVGAIIGFNGLMIAKHVLVAVLMMEVGVDDPRPASKNDAA